MAFFGGMPRRFVHAGQVLEAVQNGDVMVLPDERGVFSRHGAMYHAVDHFVRHYVGPGCAYAFAYGFPSERAFKLGFKLGLYAEAGRMMELRWAPLPAQRHFGWACTPLQAIRRAADVGRAEGLRYVYSGNLPGDEGEKTFCHDCGHLLIDRFGYTIRGVDLDGARCPRCRTPLAGVFS